MKDADQSDRPELPAGWVDAPGEAQTLEELLTQLHSVARPAWLFRGESRWFPSRKSTLGRLAPDNAGHSAKIEANFLFHFLRQAHSSFVSEDRTFLDTAYSLQLLMQQHGAPTRLLDWSYSAWVAAYFAACNDFGKAGYLWMYQCKTLFETLPPDWRRVGERLLNLPVAEYRSFLESLGEERAFAIVPAGVVEATRRMAAQQTTMTWGYPASIDHASAIGGVLPHGAARVLRIPATLKKGLLQSLAQMNLTGSTLFPGLDGAGRFLRDAASAGIDLPGFASTATRQSASH